MTAPDPASPCIRVCTLDPETNLCLGCFRTLDEIAGWSGFSREEKWAILRQLDARKRAHAKPREG